MRAQFIWDTTHNKGLNPNFSVLNSVLITLTLVFTYFIVAKKMSLMVILTYLLPTY